MHVSGFFNLYQLKWKCIHSYGILNEIIDDPWHTRKFDACAAQIAEGCGISNYYVFRINYDDRFKLIRRELVNDHLLRQGWGTYGMALDSSYDTFKAGWQSEWEKDLLDETMRARYNNLSIMLEIEPGDYIIVPKVSVEEEYVCRSFVIAKCKKKYRFDVLAEAEDIGELFIKNGYTLTDNNWYDGEGGDVDLVFECFNRNTLMYNIYEICDVKMPHIYVQAKKKTGKDAGDLVGVDQLVKMEERIPEKNAVLMVINLTDEFSDAAKEKADENGIILIKGLTFASLLVRYGIEVVIL